MTKMISSVWEKLLLEPPLLFGPRKGLVHEEEPTYLGVVKPAQKARDVLPLDGSKAQILPVEHGFLQKEKGAAYTAPSRYPSFRFSRRRSQKW